jgi:hypothetical protein
MLALKQALSLVTIKPIGWTPTDEPTLVGWWRHAVGITDSGSPNYQVEQWNDQSTNNNHFRQSTSSERPVNGTGANNGRITFDASNSENLDTTSQISLTDDFTIGVKLNLASGGGVLLADNTTNGEFFRFFSTSIIRIKIDNATAIDISKDSGTFLGESYMVLTRVSDVITLYWNGVAQADTETLSGTADIDNLGVRKTDTNPYDGTIEEVQIYSGSSATLTADVNDRLSSL